MYKNFSSLFRFKIILVDDSSFQNIPVCYQLLLSYVSAVVKRIGGTLNCYLRSGILIAVIILIVVLLIVYIIKQYGSSFRVLPLSC